MVRRESHIDVLFREGLKDMEVLPPAYLWDDIAPAVRSTSGKGIIYRIAAGVAVLTSLGIMSYYLATGSFSSLQNGIADAENISPDNPVRESFVASLDETNDVVNETAVREIIEEADMPDTEAPSKVAMAGFGETMVADAGSSKLRYDIIYENRNPKGIEFDNLESGFDPDKLSPVKEKRGFLSASRWNVGAQVSPTYMSPNLKTAAASTPALRNSESAVMSYSGGVNVSYKMNSRLSFQTGIYYSSMGRMIYDLQLYGDFSSYAQTAKSGEIFSVETSMGQLSSTNKDIYIADATNTRINSNYSVDNFDPVKEGLPVVGDRVKQSFEFLEIPLLLRYKVIDKKVDVNILGGMSYNFLVGNEAVGMGDGFRTDLGSTPGMDGLLLSSSVGMSMEYNLNKNLSFNFEPRLRYYLNSDGNMSFLDNPYTIGVFSGLFYNF